MITKQHATALLILSITTSLFLLGAPENVTSSYVPNQDVAVIFDLNGVLMQNGGETKILGLKKFIPYALMYGFSCKKRLKKNMYALYESIETRTPHQARACDQEGILLPQLMCEWMRGTQTPATILEKIETEAKNRPSGLEIDLITSIARMVFTPELFIQTQHPVQEAIQFVQELKESGYKVYVLSNFDALSFRLLQEKYPEIFSLFDGIMISGDVGLLKPERAIYEYLLEVHAIDRTKAFFIDDQITNVQAAESTGIKSTLCTLKKGVFSHAPDTRNVRSQFYTWRNHLNEPHAVAA